MAAMEHSTYVKQMLQSNRLDPSVEKEEQVSIIGVTSVTGDASGFCQVFADERSQIIIQSFSLFCAQLSPSSKIS